MKRIYKTFDPKEHYRKHRERIIEGVHRWNRNLRIEVLTHYGNGKMACIKCGFDDMRALSIDHIEGEGNKQRKELGKQYLNFYYWLKQQGFPKGYQTLCLNCQRIKQLENKEFGGGRPWER